ncbi:MAG: hypothetical protein ACK4PR_12420, partial [Gammaproteobacteria bacterium]
NLDEIEQVFTSYDNYIKSLVESNDDKPNINQQLKTFNNAIETGRKLFVSEYITPNIAREQELVKKRLEERLPELIKLNEEIDKLSNNKLPDIIKDLDIIIDNKILYTSAKAMTPEILKAKFDELKEKIEKITIELNPVVNNTKDLLEKTENDYFIVSASDHKAVVTHKRVNEHLVSEYTWGSDSDDTKPQEINLGFGAGTNSDLAYTKQVTKNDVDKRNVQLTFETEKVLSDDERLQTVILMVNNYLTETTVDETNKLDVSCDDEYALNMAVLYAKTLKIPANHVKATLMDADQVAVSEKSIEDIYKEAENGKYSEMYQKMRATLRTYETKIEFVDDVASAQGITVNAYDSRDAYSNLAKQHKHPDKKNSYYQNGIATAAGTLFTENKKPTFNVEIETIKDNNRKAEDAHKHITENLSMIRTPSK